ncbi:DUF1223 domain-containing protein [Oleiphilus messinensis]|uniref:DUF1223 domain-containing protein n=1 Tax=Oleiphilus messinensis TaxID=141451 RepID=UPI0018E018C1|nr:DUF1223 domain-containing protein [Oleiphilus messinensis]
MSKKSFITAGILSGILSVSMSVASASEEGLLLADANWSVKSGSRATDVIELFTSEGCSSCPPADTWLSGLKQQSGLYQQFIPLAYHVDYWDRLGWKDRFASKAYSALQRRYARSGIVKQVYTPGFVINSHEFRGWFAGQREWPANQSQPGVLAARIQQGSLDVKFPEQERLILNLAYLGNGLKTNVKAGENRGETLHHDFVVLHHQQYPGQGNWRLALPDIPDQGQQETVLALWLTSLSSPRIIQAVAAPIGEVRP